MSQSVRLSFDASTHDILRRIRGEYVEMPGLTLTPLQARRLFGLAPDICDDLLGFLVADGFLCRTRTGAYRRAEAV